MFLNKNRTRLLIVCLLLIFILAADVFADSEHIDTDKITAESVNYHTATAEYGNIETTLKTPGSLYYPSSVEALYEGRDAYYEETLASYGDVVKKGDPLLKIRTIGDPIREEELSIELARANEDYAAALADNQAELDRLTAARAAAVDTYEARFLDIDIARKQLEIEKLIYETEKMIAGLEAALSEIHEENSVIYALAPRDGTVMDMQSFRQGDVLTDGTYICSLYDEDISFIRVDNPNYRYGSEVEIMTRFSNDFCVYKGEVTVSGSAMPNAGFEGCLIRLTEEPDEGENFFNINVTGSDIDLRNVLLIPAETRDLAGGRSVVKIVDSDNVLHKRVLNVGLQTREMIWVLDGVSEGDRLVIGN